MFGTGSIFNYFHCSNCGCLQLDRNNGKTDNLYGPNYYSFSTYKINRLSRFLKSLVIRYSVATALGHNLLFGRLLNVPKRDAGSHALKGKITPSSRILDVGCGDGSLIIAMSEIGYKFVEGLDPFLECDVITDKYKILKKKIESYPGKELFDIIMFNHSFEHMSNPFEILIHAKRLLKNNGLCIIRIPVSDSFAFKTYQENWVQLDAPRHIFLHTNRSMAIVSEKSGFKLDQIINDSGIFQFIGSEQYRKGISLNDERSYYVPLSIKYIFGKYNLFSRIDISEFARKTVELNNTGEGDQRVFYLSKKIC